MTRLVALLLVCGSSVRAEGDELLAPFARAKTIEACRAALKQVEAEGLPTSYVRAASQEAAACTRRVMNAEVDKLIVPLKKSNRALFQRNMDAQRFFNEAVKSWCGRWNAWYENCCVTCSYAEAPACEMAFHATRVKQVRALGALGESKPATRARTADFAKYAAEWCAFLADGKDAGSDTCVARVLGQLEAEQPDDGAPLSCK